MGDLFKPKVSTPSIPQSNAVDNFVNTRDDIAGTESVKVQQPDGTWTIVTRRLPLTAEQQAEEDNLKRIAAENLTRFEDLSNNFDIDQIDGLREAVDAFTTTNKRILGESFKTATEAGEKSLARGGLDDSTAAVQQRSRDSKSFRQGLEQIGRDAEGFKQNVREQAKADAMSLYGLATGRQDAILRSLATSAAGNTGTALSLTNMNAQGQWNRYNAALEASRNKTDASQAGMGNLLSLAKLGTTLYGGYKGWFN